MSDLNALVQRHFLYAFNNQALIKQALTHRSFGADHNEKLEFLGDAILGVVVAKELYRRFPTAREGELSRLRSTVVSGEALAKIARFVGLGGYLRLGGGELSSGGRDRDSILADAVEAILGAIFLESGFDASQVAILSLFNTSIEALSLQDSKDPKTQLQELLQAKKQRTPHYKIVKTEGAQHQQTFYVECEAFGKVAQGVGGSRRKAEQAAAKQLLEDLS